MELRFVVLVLAILVCGVASQSRKVVDDDEVMRQVLEEEQAHYGDEYERHYEYREYDAENEDETIDKKSKEELLRKQKEEAEEAKRQEKERKIAEEAERVRQEREAAFEMELAQAEAAKAKALLKQKKKDARIVRRVLKDAKSGNHYKVLGLWYMELEVPERKIALWKCTLRIPGIRFFHISQKDIRKAYRKLSLAVHPDRNRDGRANEAFVALENSASILSDESKRAVFDKEIRLARQKKKDEALQAARVAVGGTIKVTTRTVGIVKSVLGPFTVPVSILGALIV